MKARTVTEELKVILDDDRRVEMSAVMATALETVGRAEETLAEAKGVAKQTIEAATAQVKGYGQDLRQGYEYAPVEVQEEPAENWMVERARTDTGEVLEPRAMTPAERQAELEMDATVETSDAMGHFWPEALDDDRDLRAKCSLCGVEVDSVGAAERCVSAPVDDVDIETDVHGHRWDKKALGVKRKCLGCGCELGTIGAGEECQEPGDRPNTGGDIMPEDDKQAPA